MGTKNTVILVGAGSMIPWKAPTTSHITDKIKKDRTFISTKEQPLGDWIYHQLKGLYHKDSNTINFETIINSLEYLATFYASKYRPSVAKFKNVMPAFFECSNKISEILDFHRIRRLNRNRNYGKEFVYDNPSWYDESDFFREVMIKYINIIIMEIESYQRNSSSEQELNRCLRDFLSSINSSDSFFRIYTTNYDRVIPLTFNEKIFEGFLEGEEKKFDRKTVLKCTQKNTYYNLHGSIHFALDFPNNVKYVPDKPICDFGKGTSDRQDQERKKMIRSNIITGFNKPSKVLESPYFEFYSRFCQDCLEAERIIIIGYSFSDIHLNKGLETAHNSSNELKIEVVTLDSDTIQTHDWLTYRSFLADDYDMKYSNWNIFSNRESINNVAVYRQGFEKYLIDKQWERNK